MTTDVQQLAADLIESVRQKDETRVREILTTSVAGEVACEVAAMAGRARRQAAAADERARTESKLSEQVRLLSKANFALVRERTALRHSLAQYRATSAPAWKENT